MIKIPFLLALMFMKNQVMYLILQSIPGANQHRDILSTKQKKIFLEKDRIYTHLAHLMAFHHHITEKKAGSMSDL